MTYKGAIKQLYEMRDNIWMPEFFKPYFDKIIETLTADVRENVRGEWRFIEGDIFGMYNCSNCGNLSFQNSEFCPNCGAEMQRGEDDE